jgi:hypothetical protein
MWLQTEEGVAVKNLQEEDPQDKNEQKALYKMIII